MIDKLKTIFTIFKNAVSGALDHEIFTFAAAIAFYTIFSLPGLLIISISVSSFFLGTEAVSGELSNQLRGFIGNNGAEAIETIVRNVSLKGDGLVGTIMAIAVLLFSSTTVFITLQDALNVVWKVDKKSRNSRFKFIINRVLSLGMVVSIGFLLFVSLILETVLSLFMGKIEYFLGSFSATVLDIIGFALSSMLIFVLIILLFKVLPDKTIKWKEVWAGAFITSFFLILGKLLIKIYIEQSDFSATYEAAGSLIVILVWVYYSTLLVLFGAEVTHQIMDNKRNNLKK